MITKIIIVAAFIVIVYFGRKYSKDCPRETKW